MQFLDVHLLVADDIGGYIFATCLVVEGLDGGVLDAWEVADDCLHLFQLDAETTNLHLTVTTTYKLDVAIGQIADNVARAIDTAVFCIGCERIGQIGLCRLLWTVQVASTYLWATDPKLTHGS